MAASAQKSVGLDQVLNALARGELRPLYLITGADQFLYRRFVAGLRQGFRKQYGDQAELIQRWGVDLRSAADLTPLLGGGSLFSSASLILIHEVQGAGPSVKTQMASILAKLPAETTVLLQYSVEDRRKAKWIEALRSLATVISLAAPERSALPQFVSHLAAEHQLQLDTAAVLRLIDLANGELAVIDNELEKLSLFLDPPQQLITQALVEQVAGALENARAVQFIEAVSRRDRVLATQTLSEISRQGKEGLPYLVAMLYNRLAQLMALREPIAARKTIGQGVTSYYFLKNLDIFSRNYSLLELQTATTLLADLDLKFRLGSLDMLSVFTVWISQVV